MPVDMNRLATEFVHRKFLSFFLFSFCIGQRLGSFSFYPLFNGFKFFLLVYSLSFSAQGARNDRLDWSAGGNCLYSISFICEL